MQGKPKTDFFDEFIKTAKAKEEKAANERNITIKGPNNIGDFKGQFTI